MVTTYKNFIVALNQTETGFNYTVRFGNTDIYENRQTAELTDNSYKQ